MTAICNSYLIKKYSFAGFRPKQNTLAKTPEPAVEPEIVKATPETVTELEVAEDTPAKTSQRTLRRPKPTMEPEVVEDTPETVPDPKVVKDTSKNTGEKPCKICLKSFSSNSSFKTHTLRFLL